jgi:hypothetical protein
MILRCLAVLALALLPAGCRHPGPAHSSTSSAAPTLSGATAWSSSKFGLRLDIPSGWTPQASNDYALLLIPAGAKTADVSITLDVPDLPPHLPGLIPIGAVKSGYLDDLRKQVGPLDTQDQTPPAIPGAKARLVRSTWQANGKQQSQTALLMTHDDRVYILRATADSAHRPRVESALQKIIQSLTWQPRTEK